jgi:hypothetical protein
MFLKGTNYLKTIKFASELLNVTNFEHLHAILGYVYCCFSSRILPGTRPRADPQIRPSGGGACSIAPMHRSALICSSRAV